MNRISLCFVWCFFTILIQSCNAPDKTYGYYASGATEWQCELGEDGVTRRCKFFSETGILRSEQLYENDKKNGVNKYYSESGDISQILTFKEGVKHGPYTLFYENGNIAESGNYYNGLKRGEIVKYFLDKRGAPQYKWLFFSFDSTELVVEKIEYSKQGDVLKTYRDVEVAYIESRSIRVNFKVPYDSGLLVIGSLDSLFVPDGKIDTIRFMGDETPTYSVANFSGKTLRGIWTTYKTTFDNDSTYLDMNIGLIQESVPINLSN